MGDQRRRGAGLGWVHGRLCSQERCHGREPESHANRGDNGGNTHANAERNVDCPAQQGHEPHDQAEEERHERRRDLQLDRTHDRLALILAALLLGQDRKSSGIEVAAEVLVQSFLEDRL